MFQIVHLNWVNITEMTHWAHWRLTNCRSYSWEWILCMTNSVGKLNLMKMSLHSSFGMPITKNSIKARINRIIYQFKVSLWPEQFLLKNFICSVKFVWLVCIKFLMIWSRKMAFPIIYVSDNLITYSRISLYFFRYLVGSCPFDFLLVFESLWHWSCDYRRPGWIEGI